MNDEKESDVQRSERRAFQVEDTSLMSRKRNRGGKKDAQQDSSQYYPHGHPEGNCGICFQG